MDKAKKELQNSLGRSPYPPYPSSQISGSPGPSSTASFQITAHKKYPVIKERGFYSDVLAPGASEILGVSILELFSPSYGLAFVMEKHKLKILLLCFLAQIICSLLKPVLHVIGRQKETIILLNVLFCELSASNTI